MGCKRVLGWALVVGSVVMVCAAVKNTSCMSSIKQNGKKITKKMDDFFTNLDENGLKKYKDNLVKEYNKLKMKVDNLTIKDIKDAGSEMIQNILDSLEDFKTNLLSYS